MVNGSVEVSLREVARAPPSNPRIGYVPVSCQAFIDCWVATPIRPAGGRAAALDGRQMESAETLWIGEDIHLNDLPAGNREADHRKHAAVWAARYRPEMAAPRRSREHSGEGRGRPSGSRRLSAAHQSLTRFNWAGRAFRTASARQPPRQLGEATHSARTRGTPAAKTGFHWG